jgi:sortase A
MRRVLAFCVLILIVVTGCRSGGDEKSTPVALVTETAAASATAVATPDATPTSAPEIVTPTPEPTPTPPPPPVAEPVRLRIPRIGVDAHIIPVGVNRYGEMDSPHDAWSVAWYAPGFKPWEPGNAVMAAHVDYIRVGPAVFYNLKTLQPGDRVIVTAADQQVYEFEVKETHQYHPATAPVERIFGPNANKGLNLITCTGTFNPRTGEYDQRTVVYTEAVVPGPEIPNRDVPSTYQQ